MTSDRRKHEAALSGETPCSEQAGLAVFDFGDGVRVLARSLDHARRLFCEEVGAVSRTLTLLVEREPVRVYREPAVLIDWRTNSRTGNWLREQIPGQPSEASRSSAEQSKATT
jgi:hypothetical protein